MKKPSKKEWAFGGIASLTITLASIGAGMGIESKNKSNQTHYTAESSLKHSLEAENRMTKVEIGMDTYTLTIAQLQSIVTNLNTTLASVNQILINVKENQEKSFKRLQEQQNKLELRINDLQSQINKLILLKANKPAPQVYKGEK